MITGFGVFWQVSCCAPRESRGLLSAPRVVLRIDPAIMLACAAHAAYFIFLMERREAGAFKALRPLLRSTSCVKSATHEDSITPNE